MRHGSAKRREALESLETLEQEALRGTVTREALAKHRHVPAETIQVDGGDLSHRVVELVDDVRGTGPFLRCIELDHVVGPAALARRGRELRAELRGLVDERRRKRTTRACRLDDIGK